MVAYTEADVLLQIDNVSKFYGDKLVLKNVSATIKDIRVPGECKGQVVGFIGPSGIGKSTLFRIMAGLEQPTSGMVKLDGLDRPVRAGEVGVVAQDYPLFNHRTVLGNLMLARKDRGVVNNYLSQFGLSCHANKYPGGTQLSGGQRQRVAILQQILAGSRFILMDEPFSGLDPLAKRDVQHLIQKVADMDELNTLVIVTHDIGAAVAVADHLWVLGRKYENGVPQPGAYIVETHNLIDLGFAWHPEVEKEPGFGPFVHELTERFATL